MRSLHNQAAEDAKALRGLEPGGDEPKALRLILSLAGRIRALQVAVGDLAGGAKGIWEQRTSWLHQELTALTTERLRDSGSVVMMLYACADNTRAAEAEKAAAESEAEKRASELAAANARAAAAEERAVGAAAAAGEAAESSASREVLELRTKAVVQQQELQRRAADVRELQQRLQAVTRERDELIGGGGGGNATGSSDSGSSPSGAERVEHARAVAECQKLLEANHVLSVNLRQHAEVVEKLIGLNAELMDKANEARAERDPEVIEGRAKYQRKVNGGGDEGKEATAQTAGGCGAGGVVPAGASPPNGPLASSVGIDVRNGGGEYGVDSEGREDGAEGKGLGKRLGKAWAFLAGDAPPVVPHIRSALADVPPV